MSTTNTTDDEWETLSKEQTIQFMQGEPVRDGQYKLSYNDDGEGFYYLKYFGECHIMSRRFDDVEYVGDDTWVFKYYGESGTHIRNIKSGYPLLRKALASIATEIEN
jgi:hypothetical protein